MQDDNNNNTKNKSTLLTVPILAAAIAVLSVALVLAATMMQQANAQNTNETSTSLATATTTFQLTATPVNGTYLWVDSNGMYNPTLMLKANTDNTISVKSLQNDSEEHELVVESWDNQTYVKSEEIKGGSSDEVLFNPGNNSSMKYYCEYHPDLMRGTIQVANKS
jgi:plastocyanin